MKLKLPFALQNNKIVEIFEVERGLKCNCVCLCCGSKLIAKKGTGKIYHFAHYKSEECNSALQTAIHLAAKEVLAKNRKICIPEVFSTEGFDKQLLHKSRVITFDEVLLEKRFGNIVPDILVKKNGVPLFIEIAVTHFVNKEKKAKIKEMGISTIEINLSKINRLISFSELENILINEVENKKWLYNTRTELANEQIRKEKELFSELESKYILELRQIAKNQKVYGDYFSGRNIYCPFAKIRYGGEGKISASTCRDCSYNYNVFHNEILCLYPNKHKIQEFKDRHKEYFLMKKKYEEE